MNTLLRHRIGRALKPLLLSHILLFLLSVLFLQDSIITLALLFLLPFPLFAMVLFQVGGVKDTTRRRQAYYGAAGAFLLLFAQFIQFFIAIGGTITVILPYWGLSFLFAAIMWVVASKIADVPYLVIRLILLLASLCGMGIAFLYSARYFLGLQ